MTQNYYRAPQASCSAAFSVDSAVCLYMGSALKSVRFNYMSKCSFILTLDPIQTLFISFIRELISVDSHPY